MEDNFHFPGLPLTYLDLLQQFPDLEKLLNWTSLDFLKTAAPAAAPPPPVTSSSIELPFGQLKKHFNATNNTHAYLSSHGHTVVLVSSKIFFCSSILMFGASICLFYITL